QRLLTVGQKLLQDLIAADGELPDRLGNILPEGGFVEEDINSIGTEIGSHRQCGGFIGCIVARDTAPTARHDRAALAGVTPAGSDLAVSLGHRAAAALR